MGNLFINLPAPGGNGVGAATDVSTMGGLKTIQMNGSWVLPNRPPTINIEMNNSPGPTGTWAPVATFQGGSPAAIATVTIAAKWMRVRISNYRGGAAPDVNVGATDDGAVFDSLPATAADGTGTAVDISAMPSLKTLQVGDAFTGSVILEISEDTGGTDWVEVAALRAPGQVTFESVSHWARIKRVGSTKLPGTPICTLGATAASAGGGGGGSVVFNKVTTQELRFSPAITPPALAAGNTNNYSPAGFAITSRVRQATNAANSTVTGFDSTGASDGDFHIIENYGGGLLVLANQNAGSLAANRITTPGGADLSIPSGGAAMLVYDGTTTSWRVDALALGDSTNAPLTLLNGNAGVIAPGTAVYSSAAGTFDKARANAIGTSLVLGLTSAQVGIAGSGPIATSGPLTLTTAQWDARTGDSGGLVFNTKYYLDPTTAGNITRTAPVAGGQVVEAIGVATSTTTLLLNPSTNPVLL